MCKYCGSFNRSRPCPGVPVQRADCCCCPWRCCGRITHSLTTSARQSQPASRAPTNQRPASPRPPHASRGTGSGASEDRSENFAAGEVTEGGELGIPQQLKNISLRFHSHVNIKKTFTTSLQFCPHTHLLNPKSCAVGFSDKVKYLMLLVNRFFCLY